MPKFLNVYDVTVRNSCYEGLIDASNLTPSQLKKLGLKDFPNSIVTCGGEFSIRESKDAGMIVTIDSMVIDGCNGMGKFPFIDVFDDHATFDHIAMQIERRLNDLGVIPVYELSLDDYEDR